MCAPPFAKPLKKRPSRFRPSENCVPVSVLYRVGGRVCVRAIPILTTAAGFLFTFSAVVVIMFVVVVCPSSTEETETMLHRGWGVAVLGIFSILLIPSWGQSQTPSTNY